MGSLVNLFCFLCKKVGPNCVAKRGFNGVKFEGMGSIQNFEKQKKWLNLGFFFEHFCECFSVPKLLQTLSKIC